MRVIDDEERRARLGLRHNLAVPSTDLVQIVRDQVGLHSSDPVAPFLSLWERVDRFTKSQLEQALYKDKSLLRMLGMRRTMFVVPTDLAAVMDAACTRALYAGEHRRLIKWIEEQGLAKNGSAWIDQATKATLASLKQRGSATARELTEDVPQLGLKLSFGEGKAYGGTVGMSTRVLFLMATAGTIVRGRPMGSWVSSQYRWAPVETWVGELPALEQDSARVELVSRWLRSYGPGTFEDIKWWTGWGVGVTRKALEGLSAVEVALSEGTGFVHPDDTADASDCPPWTAFLPGLDPTTMGWKQRSWYLGEHAGQLFDRNGNAGPTVWVNGRVVGGWTNLDDGRIAVKLLETVSRDESAEIESKAAELEGWLGDVRVRTRFPVPLEKELKSPTES